MTITATITQRNVTGSIVQTNSAYPKPIVHWKLNGNGNDSIGTNHLTPTGSIVYEAGKLGQCANMNTNGTQYDMPDLDTYFDSSKDFTLAFWFKTSITPDYDGVLQYKATQVAGPNQGITFQINPNGQIYARLDTSTLQNYTHYAAVVNDGNWHLIIITHATATKTLAIYMDNVFKQSKVYTGVWSVVGGTNIYRRIHYTTGMDSSYDSIILYNKVLSTEELSMLWNSGNGNETLGEQTNITASLTQRNVTATISVDYVSSIPGPITGVLIEDGSYFITELGDYLGLEV